MELPTRLGLLRTQFPKGEQVTFYPTGVDFIHGVLDRAERDLDDERAAREQAELANAELLRILGALIECPYTIDEASIPAGGIDVAPEQVVGTMSVSLAKVRRAREALAQAQPGAAAAAQLRVLAIALASAEDEQARVGSGYSVPVEVTPGWCLRLKEDSGGASGPSRPLALLVTAAKALLTGRVVSSPEATSVEAAEQRARRAEDAEMRAATRAQEMQHRAEQAERLLEQERTTHRAFQDAVEQSAASPEAKVANIEAQTQEALSQRDMAREERTLAVADNAALLDGFLRVMNLLESVGRPNDAATVARIAKASHPGAALLEEHRELRSAWMAALPFYEMAELLTRMRVNAPADTPICRTSKGRDSSHVVTMGHCRELARAGEPLIHRAQGAAS